ncbi:hypothetical protein L226DRAFT_115303 [Lentinus tigrinus ALCF2SS1-7]|uniref:uncharacterized protein n=1 Tax=Lentinus tigrinus ALCF2SS1-7 TaxID=1328758 RepID=UPI001165E684|nr:hypothetical protein L226DRAFT_115303 [Lentinus tigrinus ALCF2SS1-7]
MFFFLPIPAQRIPTTLIPVCVAGGPSSSASLPRRISLICRPHPRHLDRTSLRFVVLGMRPTWYTSLACYCFAAAAGDKDKASFSIRMWATYCATGYHRTACSHTLQSATATVQAFPPSSTKLQRIRKAPDT